MPGKSSSELSYPFHDRDVVITAYGRLYPASQADQHLNRAAGQKLGIREVDDGILLVSFMHDDLRYFDLERKTLQPRDNPRI